jgi:hypothetical protein
VYVGFFHEVSTWGRRWGQKANLPVWWSGLTHQQTSPPSPPLPTIILTIFYYLSKLWRQSTCNDLQLPCRNFWVLIHWMRGKTDHPLVHLREEAHDHNSTTTWNQVRDKLKHEHY